MIPKAETNKEIKQPPNIGIRKRRTQNKTPKQPIRQTPDDSPDEFVKTRSPELQIEYDLYEDQKKNVKTMTEDHMKSIFLKMLAGVSYKKNMIKMIPKAETNKEIKQPQTLEYE